MEENNPWKALGPDFLEWCKEKSVVWSYGYEPLKASHFDALAGMMDTAVVIESSIEAFAPGYSKAKLDRLMPPCVDGELPEGWR